MILVQVQQVRTGTRYGLGILQQLGKWLKTVKFLILAFGEVTGGKLVARPFCLPLSWIGLTVEVLNQLQIVQSAFNCAFNNNNDNNDLKPVV